MHVRTSATLVHLFLYETLPLDFVIGLGVGFYWKFLLKFLGSPFNLILRS